MPKFRVPVPPIPKKNYKLTVLPENQEILVDKEKIPYGKHGLPGSVLDIILSTDDIIVEHTCGGVQACSTCHIYVEKGADSCNEMSEVEEDNLEKAPAVNLDSRLACCCVPDGSDDVVVRIPNWNRNEVQER